MGGKAVLLATGDGEERGANERPHGGRGDNRVALEVLHQPAPVDVQVLVVGRAVEAGLADEARPGLAGDVVHGGVEVKLLLNGVGREGVGHLDRRLDILEGAGGGHTPKGGDVHGVRLVRADGSDQLVAAQGVEYLKTLLAHNLHQLGGQLVDLASGEKHQLSGLDSLGDGLRLGLLPLLGLLPVVSTAVARLGSGLTLALPQTSRRLHQRALHLVGQLQTGKPLAHLLGQKLGACG